MTSPTTLAVLFFLAFLVLLQRRRVARSELEPLKVRIIPPKSVDVVVSAMAEPLRAPVPSVSSVVAGAQRLSISDPTAGVDDLLSSFSSFSMKACHLRSCLKRNHRSPSHPRVRKQVHFNTLPEHSDIIVSDLTLFEISPRENRPMQRIPASSNTPHIPGSKFIRPYTGGRLELLKAVGTYKPPGSPLADRPRCKLLKNFDCCSICLRPPKQSNLWLPDTPRKGFFTSTPLPRRSTNLPYFT